MLHTPVSDRSATELLAQAHASDHAAMLALNEGNYARARAHAVIGRLRVYLYEIALSKECRDCSGAGIVTRSCTRTDCKEADRGSTHHRHWGPCPNRASHRSSDTLPADSPQESTS
ncbi:hypothetical protein [Streptomyces cinereoruber]